MNSITEFLDLEDEDIRITNVEIQGHTKMLTIETCPTPHYCPHCGFRMHSKGIKTRTINHPILQDNYHLVLLLKQLRWKCTNIECNYDFEENFRFVQKNRRSTNATNLLIIDAHKYLFATSASIARRFHVSDTLVYEIFDRYVKLDRLPLTQIISIDEVHVELDEFDSCKYSLVIQDFYAGNPIDLLPSRRASVTESYFPPFLEMSAMP